MLKQISRFYRTIKSFIYCLLIMKSGLPLTREKLTIGLIEQLWNYCRKWEEGSL